MPVGKTVLAKQSQTHKKWYLAVILIALVAVAGILILRFSRASTLSTADCTPSAATTNALRSANMPNDSTQRCMTIAFLNKYYNYHSQVGNLNAVQSSSEAAGASANSTASTATQTTSSIPKVPPSDCVKSTWTKPVEASYPVVSGTGDFKQPNSIGRQFTMTANFWLGTTGACFYPFASQYFHWSFLDPNTAWCAYFVSYVYAANNQPTYGMHLIPSVNDLVRLNYGNLVFTDVVKSGQYTPKSGDLVIYEANGDGFYDHVGIVNYVTQKDGIKYVISDEGNVRVDPNNQAPYVPDSTNIVSMRVHNLNDPKIIGYVRAPGNNLDSGFILN